MKKHLFTILLAIVASIGTLFAESGTCGENLTWDLTDNVLTISGSGAMTDYSSYDNRSPWYSYSSSIATVIIGDEVTSIGVVAFKDCSGLTSVTIGNSVTSIGVGAFRDCSSLTSITIPESVTTIGVQAFLGCSSLTSVTLNSNAIVGKTYTSKYNSIRNIFGSQVKEYIIGNSVTSIGQSAFEGCSSMTSVTIPNSVTSIGDRAFCDCYGLTSITIPNSVTSIGGAAFASCSGLTSVTIPNSVTSINYTTFAYCRRLTSVTIPNSVTSIGSSAFASCSGLTSVTIPNSVTSIGSYAFEYCSGLTSVTIGESVTSIGSYAFNDCNGLTSITIPYSVTSIGSGAFASCSGLTSVTIPESVTSIGDFAFSGVPNIVYNGTATGSPWGARTINGYIDGYLVYSDATKTTLTACFPTAQGDIVIHNSVTSIGNYAFEYCSGLTSVTIPESVTSISNYTFYECRGLTSVTIPNSVTSIGEYAFRYCSGLTSVTIPEGVTSIGSSAFEDCSGLTSVTIPNSVTSIGFAAFRDCSSLPVIDNLRYADTYLVEAVDKTLSNYTIQEGTRWIGSSAFSHCSELTLVTIPESVTSIDENAFYGCSGMTSVTIPNSVTSISFAAFRDCTGLTSISIPKNVTSIGDDAFRNCTNLHTIYALATTPPSISNRTFKDVDKNAIVYTALGCYSAYKAASVWKDMNIQHPYQINVTSSTATSATITFEELGVNIASVGIEGGEQEAGNVLEYIGLEPNSEYKDIPIVLTANTGETETVNVSFTTTALELTTQPSKAVSSTTAILLAETNMSDAEINCGFEYKRNDAPADMAGTKVYAPVANGTMAGRLKNLKDDVYYKYRAFYESAAGNMYYGDWQYIFTGDNAIEFDPILYTYAATAVSESQATIKGYALAGSDDFTEQGFEYWADSRTANASSAPRRMPAALGKHHFVQANGISMRVTLTDLDAGTVYKYRTYAKMGEQVIYGTEMSFTTTGEYKAPTYTVVFYDYDNSVIDTQSVEDGSAAVAPADPKREWYNFAGWLSEDEKLYSAEEINSLAVTANTFYTAQYTVIEDGLEDVTNSDASRNYAQKVIINGTLYILTPDGTIFNTQGARVK